jgi:hypothetical protein
MSTERDLARLALSLVEGTIRSDSAADDLLADGFSDQAEAARAHAYLSGFVIETLAIARGEQPAKTCEYLRGLLT